MLSSGATVLGMRKHDSVELIGRIKAGFDKRCVLEFESMSGLSLEKIAEFAGIPSRTLARRLSQGRLRPNESDQLLRIARVFGRAVDFFDGDVDSARQWLLSPQLGLGGCIPLEYASNDVGAREVENLIGRLEDGVIT